MLIKDYLKNSVSFEVPDATISCILELRGETLTSEISVSDMKSAELSLADVLMYGSTYPTTSRGAKDSDGGWSHTDATVSMSITDKSDLRKRAAIIYRKYGEVVEGLGIKIQNLNGTRFRRYGIWQNRHGYGY